MPLNDLVSAQAIIPALRANSKKQVLQELAARASELSGVPEREIFDTLLQRERLGSTGLGQGVAIPHGRIKGLKEALGAFIRLAQPVPFDAPDGNAVSLVFVLLVPEKATEKHLQILSELAQMFSDKSLREAMSRAADAAALHELIALWQPDAAGQRRAAA